MKLTEMLTRLEIGTPAVPVLSAGIRNFAEDSDDPRRIVTVDLLVFHGAELVDDSSDASNDD
jgi:hypothetical protein